MASGASAAPSAGTAGGTTADTTGSGRPPGTELPGVVGATENPAEGTKTVLVHVAGAVMHPGIVELAPDSRVYQAVQRAGGETPEAALDGINLAAPLQDGEQLVVPTRQQVDSGYAAGFPVNGRAATSGASPGATPVGVGAVSGGTGVGAKVNLNTADEAQLTTLPRVGPVLASRIIAWRADHGRFGSVQELDAVEGVGPKMLDSLLPLVTV